jgi:hypothetical protein
MSQSSNDLSQELAVISDVFSDLGERLLHAARQLHAPGAPPPEALVAELTSSRRDFLGLRDRARERAGALGVSCPPADAQDTIQTLTSLLDQVAEAEIRQAKGEEVRRRALSVLERAKGLTYAGSDDFAPLRECRDRAHQLHSTIAGAPWSDLPPETERLAEGDHAFAHLLSLLDDREELNDDRWATLHDSVGATFGKQLAAAAARCKLSVPTENSAPAETRSAPEKPAGQGKRSLGKATQSSR